MLTDPLSYDLSVASSFFDIGQSKLGLKQKPIELGAVRCYTFGAPRVGNSAFARYFEEVFDGREAFRVVNGEAIVARLPRHANSAGALLDYEHVGRTVLIAESAAEADGFDGVWVEGSSDEAGESRRIRTLRPHSLAASAQKRCIHLWQSAH